jgi:hypothetical protein
VLSARAVADKRVVRPLMFEPGGRPKNELLIAVVLAAPRCGRQVAEPVKFAAGKPTKVFRLPLVFDWPASAENVRCRRRWTSPR